MPKVLPVQPISLGASTRSIVDVMVPGPAFQRKTDPAARSPCTDIDFTSGFQLGQFSRSVSTSQTACELAAISISAVLTTGAFLLTSMAVNNLHGARTAAACWSGPRIAISNLLCESWRRAPTHRRRLRPPCAADLDGRMGGRRIG